ncbi:16502_t:CDS:2, partial [Dentiscutata heterogama]
WSSNNKKIDEFIKNAQKSEKYYDKIIEWIPFERLSNIKPIGEGGFGIVYSANWFDGKRKYLSENKKIKLTREEECKVALKGLKEGDFLEEFKASYECQLKKYSVEKYAIETYGITFDPINKKYMMVLEYADKGVLREYISKNFLKWEERIEILCSISDNLNHIHKQEICHRDLHSGNIIMTSVWDFKDLKISIYPLGNRIVVVSQVSQDAKNKSNIEPKIIDLGFSRKIGDATDNKIFGIEDYIAPEILFGSAQNYTKASDIYSLGVIMLEMSIGKSSELQPRFSSGGVQNCAETSDIYGLVISEMSTRKSSELRLELPNCYKQLAERCMHKEPSKRPTAEELYNELQEWKGILKKEENELDYKQRRIKLEFLNADKIDSVFSITLQE